MPVPPQYKEAELIDFRNATLGPRGYKMSRKRTIEEREEQVLYQAVMILISRPYAQDFLLVQRQQQAASQYSLSSSTYPRHSQRI